MASLGFGIVCVFVAVKVLRLPEDAFENKLNGLSGLEKSGPKWYYRFVRSLFWALGGLGVAMIVLRFF